MERAIVNTEVVATRTNNEVGRQVVRRDIYLEIRKQSLKRSVGNQNFVRWRISTFGRPLSYKISVDIFILILQTKIGEEAEKQYSKKKKGQNLHSQAITSLDYSKFEHRKGTWNRWICVSDLFTKQIPDLIKPAHAELAEMANSRIHPDYF